MQDTLSSMLHFSQYQHSQELGDLYFCFGLIIIICIQLNHTMYNVSNPKRPSLYHNVYPACLFYRNLTTYGVSNPMRSSPQVSLMMSDVSIKSYISVCWRMFVSGELALPSEPTIKDSCKGILACFPPSLEIYLSFNETASICPLTVQFSERYNKANTIVLKSLIP